VEGDAGEGEGVTHRAGNTLRRVFPTLDYIEKCVFSYGEASTEKDTAYSRDWKRRDELLEESKSFLHRGHANLNSRLHDSWVQGASFEQGILTLALNDFSTHCLADILVDSFNLSIPHEGLVFPIELNFFGPRVQAPFLYRINKNGNLIPINFTKFGLLLDSFLYDEIVDLTEGELEIGILFDLKLRLRHSPYIPTCLMWLKAERMEIVEHQREAFTNLFSEKFLDVFDRFWEQRSVGKVFDCSNVGQFI